MLLTLLRGRTVGTMVLSAVLMMATTAIAADTAADLLQQGIKQMEAGDYAAAQQTLNRVDRVQLNDAAKTSYDQATRQLAGYLNADEQLAAARQAESGGNLQQAKELYRQVTADTNAPRKLRQAALNGLARVERRLLDGAPATAAPQPTVTAPPAQPANEDMTPVEVAQADPNEVQIDAASQRTVSNEAGSVTVDGPATIVSEPARSPAAGSSTTADGPAPTRSVEVETVDIEDGGADRMLAQARQLRAQELVAEGQAAADAGDYTRAINAFEQALANDPDNQAAIEGLENVRAASRSKAGEGVLDTSVTAFELRRQRALARYEESMTEASQAMAAGNYGQASDAVSLAKSILDTNRQVISEAEYRRLRQESLNLGAEIEALAEQQRIEQLAAEQEAIADKQAAARAQAEQEKTRKINEFLRRARDLSREQNYEQALEQIDQVLFLEPTNAAAKFMRDLITDQMIQVQWGKIKRDRGVEMAQQTLDSLRDTVPHTELLIYPPDWPDITRRRVGGETQFAESEASRVTREKLQQPIPVDFRANRLENVIEYLRNVTGANFFVQWRAMEAAGIAKDTPITMQLQNVAADKALRLILDEAGGDLVNLDFTVDEGVVVVATKEFLAQKTTIRTYDIRDLTFQAPQFSEVPEFDLDQVASDTEGGGGSSIFQDTDTDTEQLSPEERTIEIMDLIRNSVDPTTWRATGGLTSSMEELNGSLIVNSTPENHSEIVSLLRMLREQQALQIVVESRFLFVTQNFLEEVGLDVDVFLQDESDSIIGNPGFIQDSDNQARAQATNVNGSLAPTGNAALTFGAVAVDAVTGALTSSPLGFVIDDLQVNVLIRATQQDVRNITLNTPRLTIFNNDRQPAFITIARQTAFVSDLEPVVADGVAAFDPEIAVVQDGVTLAVQGAISADRRYVRLYVRPSLAQLTDLREFAISAIVTDDGGDTGDGGGDGGTTTTVATGTIQQPEIQITTLETQVSVPDKGTLLLGGQRLVGEVEVESGVPVLSKIPLLNRLFTNRAITRDERTLLVLIKPTIIIQTEQEEQLFPGLNQAPEAYNLGVQP